MNAWQYLHLIYSYSWFKGFNFNQGESRMKFWSAECFFNPRHDAFFAEDLEQVVEAGAGGFAITASPIYAAAFARRKPGASGRP
jgi:hypothetical protein